LRGLCEKFLSTQFPSNAKKIMKDFHEHLLKYIISQCEVCQEAWPALSKYKICNRCKRDKSFPKKFSYANDMIPSQVPNELSDLSQAEEMLIARALPFMNIYCKPEGGQRAYKGHVITFPTDIQIVANILPNLLEDIPIIRVTSCENYKSRVPRDKVLVALSWLVENNPLYRDVIIDQSRLNSLPIDNDVSCNLVNIEDQIDDNLPVDTGPEFSEKIRPEVSNSFVPLNLNRKTQFDSRTS